MSTTIDSMNGIVIKSPFFDGPSALELFPTHPNVLKIRAHLIKTEWHFSMGQMEAEKAQLRKDLESIRVRYLREQ